MYIKKQPLLEKCKSLAKSPFASALMLAEIEKAEGIDIVFCKECRYNNTTFYEGKYFCIVYCVYKKPTDFCSRGERGTYGGAE